MKLMKNKLTNMGEAQAHAESCHWNSLGRIAETEGRFISDADKERIAGGVDTLKVVEYDPFGERSGGYRCLEGKSEMEISVLNKEQVERTTMHETNHFVSHHSETSVPSVERNGVYEYQTVGLRHSSWFRSNETGKVQEVKITGRGLNEGVTTMYTNRQLMELDRAKGLEAARTGIYQHATELSSQLEKIVGSDVLKEAYYGGKENELKERVDRLGGAGTYERLRECMDGTVSPNYYERINSTARAQKIMEELYEGAKRK